MDIAREELMKKPEEISAEKLQVCLVYVVCLFVPYCHCQWRSQLGASRGCGPPQRCSKNFTFYLCLKKAFDPMQLCTSLYKLQSTINLITNSRKSGSTSSLHVHKQANAYHNINTCRNFGADWPKRFFYLFTWSSPGLLSVYLSFSSKCTRDPNPQYNPCTSRRFF